MKIGVLGGSFNPPHIGHLLLSVYALTIKDLDRVFVVPCFRHPFGKDLIDFKHRLKMCGLAFGDFKRHIKVSDIEKKLGDISRTLYTLKALKKKHKNHQFTYSILFL